jgi:alcohol dehydrogenase class IV
MVVDKSLEIDTMFNTFFCPTRLIYGQDALKQLPALLNSAGLMRPMLVSDPIISKTTAYEIVERGLRDANVSFLTFNECGIDARVAQVDAQSVIAKENGVDCVIALGGGSVLCTGKGIAITTPNFETVRQAEGILKPSVKPLPMIMIPTTAGSGSEVSQFTIIKDDERHRKFVTGGPSAFPQIAILDPVVLKSLPKGPAAVSAVDALTHGIEAIFSKQATSLTDAIAVKSLELLVGCLRKSILDCDPQAQATNLLAASMANIACGNTRLCLAHSLGEPLGGICHIPHGIAVGVLMPHVLAFNAAETPDRVARVAEAFGLSRERRSINDLLGEMRRLYADIGFPRCLTAEQLDPSKIDQLSRETVTGLYGGGSRPEDATDETLVPSPNVRQATVADVAKIYRACTADW